MWSGFLILTFECFEILIFKFTASGWHNFQMDYDFIKFKILSEPHGKKKKPSSGNPRCDVCKKIAFWIVITIQNSVMVCKDCNYSVQCDDMQRLP